MENLRSLSWPHIAGAIVVYAISLGFYRLFLHPLARFPGPRLAALTRYYEAYYDVICNGQYTFKIAELHEKYGPIIRISPYELHCADSAFFEKLYGQDCRLDKYAWSYDAFSAPESTICTISHEAHRRRRAPLNPFFSKASVARKQDIIRAAVDKLCQRISAFSDSQKTMNLSHAMSALARDVSAQFILAKSYSNLDAEDFDAGMTGVLQSSGAIWRVTKHVRWLGPLVKSMPLGLIEKIGDDGTKAFMGFLKDVLVIATDAVKTASRPDRIEEKTSLVDEILDSNLPPAEKTIPRMNDELGTITGAAFETTANALRLVLFFVYQDARILETLREEIAASLRSIRRAEVVDMDISALEQLPYLTAVLKEGLRLSPGIATRMARVAPDQTLAYNQWQIPAGTPVGMTSLLLHMDKDLYPDPKRFEPARWLDESFRRKANKTFSPFSKGTRICLGMHLAWAELYMVVASLVAQFDFEFIDAGLKDIECVSDQFIPGFQDLSGIKAKVTRASGGL